MEAFNYHIGNRLGWHNPLLPPSQLHSVGDSAFIETGNEFIGHFVNIARLQPHEVVLDIGCGTGRMALPLSKYLTTGEYHGTDIVQKSVDWCKQAYSERHPNFHFYFADIHNTYYNPHGNLRPSEYYFPFEDESFDFVFLTSVFTHMLPIDVSHYMSEIGRLLKPEGRTFITWFELNDESLALMSINKESLQFDHEFEGCRVKDRLRPEFAVAHYHRDIVSYYSRNGLKPREPFNYGRWCGRQGSLSYQDVVVADKLATTSIGLT